jgi:PadR family transcriptional regulator PadR
MDLENTKAQMRKGILEYCILSILYGDSRYASDIIKELKEGKVIVVEGTLYPLLTRLKNAGLLSYRWEESHIMSSPQWEELISPSWIDRGKSLWNL